MQRRQRKSSQIMTIFRDWRQALHTPHMYRVVGNRTTPRFSNQFFMLLAIVIILILLIFFYTHSQMTVNSSINSLTGNEGSTECLGYNYNPIYPITAPIKTSSGVTYKIAIISDLDLESKSSNEKNTWISIFKKGRLFWSPQNKLISVSWDTDEIHLSSTLAMKGRGMELSELITFDGVLTSFDDRSGIVYQIDNDKAYPWIILLDGDGRRKQKGFKSEWATIKNKELYVGSMGKEWTSPSGEFLTNNPMWVKIISPCGQVRSVDWMGNFMKLRKAINIEFPGYMIHESGVWSDIHNRWFFLPRRCSQDQYNETRDEIMSCNVLLVADEDFTNIKVTLVDNSVSIRGFASFKFLPGSHDTIIVALKTEEYQGQTATYFTAFTIDGATLVRDIKIAEKKFEGLEFI